MAAGVRAPRKLFIFFPKTILIHFFMNTNDFRKQYRFLKRHLFNEEVFKIKLKHFLDIDMANAPAAIEKLWWQDDEEKPKLEEIQRFADEIYKSESLIDTIKENIENAKGCEGFDDFDLRYADWSDIVDDPLNNMSRLFPNAFEYLNPFGIEDL